MEDWQRVSALVIGFGSIGRRHTRVLKEIGVEDVRVAEVFPELREMAKNEFGIQRVYESLETGLADGPQTVFVCSPTAMHVEQITAAMRAGADVCTEKPLAASLDGLDDLEAEAKKLGRIVMVAHCFRWHEGLAKAKKWADEGRIGRIVSIRALVGEYIPEAIPNYLNMYYSQYSGCYELMHDVDLALWYAGQPPKRVMGMQGSYSDVGMKSPDVAEMLIEFPDRLMANVHLDFFERCRHRQIELLGTEGQIYVEFAKWDKCCVSIYEAAKKEWQCEEMDTDRDDMFRAENTDFLRAVVSRSAVPVDITEGRKAVDVILAAQKSADSGCGVIL
jgi:predicted dehydrogenase